MNNDQLIQFINEYKLKKVVMNVESDDGNKIIYTLLIADNLFIIDYKIQFIQIAIKNLTTASHEISKKNNESLKWRKLFLKTLKIEHKYNVDKKNNKEIFRFNLSDINLVKLNQELLKDPHFAKDITLQNIEYILTGSNPGGQGRKNKSGTNVGYLKTSFQNKFYAFGLFLKTINMSNNFFEKNQYDDAINVYLINHLFQDTNSIKTETFEEWLTSSNTQKIYKYWESFVNYPENWKNIRQDFQKEFSQERIKYLNALKIISKYRNEYRNSINDYYKNDYTKLYNDYFKIDSLTERAEYAHIKPVSLIKQEYLDDQKNNKAILEQIKDINNFLPLTPSLHAAFDHYDFYWNENGELQIINEHNLPNNIKDFQNIAPQKLIKISQYIKEYKSKIIDQLK